MGEHEKRLREALERINSLCPPYSGEYSESRSLSDFGGNEDDCRNEMQAIAEARIGDIARAALCTKETTGNAP